MSMGDIAISVQGLSKAYRLGGRPLANSTFRDSVADAWRRALRRSEPSGGRSAAGDDLFWAVKDVSFEVIIKEGKASLKATPIR